MRPGAPGVEDFGLWLTLEQLTVPLPLAEVFVTSDWLRIWSVIGLTYVLSRKIQLKDSYDGFPPIGAK